MLFFLIYVLVLIGLYRFLIDRVFVGELFATDGVRQRRIHVNYINGTLWHAYVDISSIKRIESYGYYTDPVEGLNEELKSVGWTIVGNQQ